MPNQRRPSGESEGQSRGCTADLKRPARRSRSISGGPARADGTGSAAALGVEALRPGPAAAGQAASRLPVDPARVMVVVPMLNEAHHAERVLRRIIGDDPLAAACTVLVADGGSDDGTPQIVAGLESEFANLRLVHNPGRSQAAALNLALGQEFGKIEFLVRCDAHALYPPRYVSDLVRCLAERDAASVVIPMDAVAGEGCFARGLAWIADTPLGAGGSPHRGGTRSGYVEHGHHAAFRMDVFRALGGYDESFRANEDAEYDRRVAKAGGRIWLEAGIRIGYLPRRDPGALWRQYWHYGAGRVRTCLKHRTAPGLRQTIPVANLALFAVSIPALTLTPAGLVWPICYVTVIAAAGAATALRRRSICGLAAAPALAIMHFAWALGFLCKGVELGLRDAFRSRRTAG